MARLVLFAFFSLWTRILSGIPDRIPLNEWPMIFAHDSATGYLESGTSHPVNQWTITQPSDELTAVTTQLKCGARAFDWRPKIAKDGIVVMHHGPVEIKHTMSAALKEFLDWAAENSGDEDFICIAMHNCDFRDCTDEVKRVFSDAGVPTFITDCSRLQGMTLEHALNVSKLPRGGHLLPIMYCKHGNWDPSVSCSGYQIEASAREFDFADAADRAGVYTCYNDSSTKAFPVKRMFDYLDKTSRAGPPLDGQPWSMQALWQESPVSIAVGELHGSSLLKDEVKSGLNHQVTQAVLEGRYPHINLLEVNNVCDGGPSLLKALRSHARRFSQQQGMPYSVV